MGKKATIDMAHEITGLSKHFLRTGAKNGTLPALRCGIKVIFDIEQLEDFLIKQAMSNVKAEEKDDTQYGKLRRIEG